MHDSRLAEAYCDRLYDAAVEARRQSNSSAGQMHTLVSAAAFEIVIRQPHICPAEHPPPCCSGYSKQAPGSSL